jgi:hypothetical protein
MKLVLFPVVALISVLALLVLSAAERCAPLPPDEIILEARAHGCAIKQEPKPDTHWYLRVWAECENRGKWERLYSVRNPDELRKVLADCDTWLACIRIQAQKLRSTP